MPETLPRRGRMQGILEAPRKLAHTSQASKSLGNIAMASSHAGTLSRGISNTSLSSAGWLHSEILLCRGFFCC